MTNFSNIPGIPADGQIAITPLGQLPQGPSRTDTLRQLAQQFESMLLTQMLRDMQSELGEGAMGSGFGGQLTDTIYGEFASALTKSGGFGLASSLEGALARTTPGSPMTEAIEGGDAVSPEVVRQFSPWLPEAPVAVPITADRISSAYGQRRDPITGHSRMHKGIDIPMAEGDEVRSLKGGVVIASGDQGAYGQTIVIDHGDGLTTRYAHLSARNVQIGETVDAGTTIGLAGRTGRATGAHLHLEVLTDGAAIDPLGHEATRRLGAEVLERGTR